MKLKRKFKAIVALVSSAVLSLSMSVALFLSGDETSKVAKAADGTFSPNDLVTVTDGVVTENYSITSKDGAVTHDGLRIAGNGYTYDLENKQVTAPATGAYSGSINGIFDASDVFTLYWTAPQHKSSDKGTTGSLSRNMCGEVAFRIADINNPDEGVWIVYVRDENLNSRPRIYLLNEYDETTVLDPNAGESDTDVNNTGYHFGLADVASTARVPAFRLSFSNKTLSEVKAVNLNNGMFGETVPTTGVTLPTFEDGYTVSFVSNEFDKKTQPWSNLIAPILLQKVTLGSSTSKPADRGETSFVGTSTESTPTWYAEWQTGAVIDIPEGTYSNTTAYTEDVTVKQAKYTINGGATDNVAKMEYRKDGAGAWTAVTAGTKLTESGSYEIKCTAKTDGSIQYGNERIYKFVIAKDGYVIPNEIDIAVSGEYKPTYLVGSTLNILGADYTYVGLDILPEKVENIQVFKGAEEITVRNNQAQLSGAGNYVVKYTAINGVSNVNNVKDVPFTVVADEKDLLGESVEISVNGAYASVYQAGSSISLADATYNYTTIDGMDDKAVEKVEVINVDTNVSYPVADGNAVTLTVAGNYVVKYTAVVDGQSANNTKEIPFELLASTFDTAKLVSVTGGNASVTLGYTTTGKDNKGAAVTHSGILIAPEGYAYDDKNQTVLSPSQTPWSARLNGLFTADTTLTQLQFTFPGHYGAEGLSRSTRGEIAFCLADVENPSNCVYVIYVSDEGDNGRPQIYVMNEYNEDTVLQRDLYSSREDVNNVGYSFALSNTQGKY